MPAIIRGHPLVRASCRSGHCGGGHLLPSGFRPRLRGPAFGCRWFLARASGLPRAAHSPSRARVLPVLSANGIPGRALSRTGRGGLPSTSRKMDRAKIHKPGASEPKKPNQLPASGAPSSPALRRGARELSPSPGSAGFPAPRVAGSGILTNRELLL